MHFPANFTGRSALACVLTNVTFLTMAVVMKHRLAYYCVTSSGVATLGPTGACAPPLAFQAPSSIDVVTHVIQRNYLSHHYLVAFYMKLPLHV